MSAIWQAELGNKQATIDKQKNNVSIASNMIKSINPDGLKAGEWRISMTQKLERLKNLEQSHSELQQVMTLQLDVHCIQSVPNFQVSAESRVSIPCRLCSDCTSTCR